MFKVSIAAVAALFLLSSIVGKDFNKLVKNAQKTAIVEFYAPWCGHCQKLKPAYEQAAKSLQDVAQVVAVNCDDDDNKSFCSSMGIKGFPTLKTVKPTLARGRPIIQDYQGPRSAKGIVDAVRGLIPNHVKRVKDEDLDSWLTENNSTAKAILFTDKSTVSALLKSLSFEFYGNLQIAQIRNNDEAAVNKFGIEKYPTLLILPGGEAPPVAYDGKMEKAPMTEFLKQYAEPAKFEAPKKEKEEKKADKSKSSSDSSSFSQASASHSSEDASSSATEGFTVTMDGGEWATASPDPQADPEGPGPVPVPETPPAIAELATDTELREKCLGEKTNSCLLAFLPPPSEADAVPPESAVTSLATLAELAEKHKKRGDHLFPFYAIPATNEAAANVKSTLELTSEVEIVVINGRRGWWRHFEGKNGYGVQQVESWIDGIRLGEGKKSKVPESLIATEKPAEDPKPEEPKHQEL